MKQSRLVKKVSLVARRALESTLADDAAAWLRSSSGPGASGFLMAPAEDAHLVEDTAFRVAVVRRLGGGICAVGGGPAIACNLRGRDGPCGRPLNMHHACSCGVGGCAIRRHNRLSRWLAAWLRQSRAPGEVLLEQRVHQEEGVMDITIAQDPRAVWIDVAIVVPSSACVRTLRQRARTDGAAARTEEGVKRRRYGDRVDPFVIETGGRPGRSARAVLMRYAREEVAASVELSNAWQSISAIVQAETSRSSLQAWGGLAALDAGIIRLWLP